MQLVACNGTTDLWADLSEFLASIGVTRVRGRIVLCEKTGNFRVRVGIQTYATDLEVPNAPESIGSGVGFAYISTVSKNFVDFDPTISGNGQIGGKPGFRLGVLYSSTEANPSRGDVVVELSIDA